MKLHEITQRMLEKYEDGLVLIGEGLEANPISVTSYKHLLIDLAIDAEIVSGLPDDLGDCKPYEIREWTIAIKAHVLEAKAPPDPN